MFDGSNHDKQLDLEALKNVIDRFYENYNLIQEQWRFMGDKEREKVLRKSNSIDNKLECLENKIKSRYDVHFDYCAEYKDFPAHFESILNCRNKEGVAANV